MSGNLQKPKINYLAADGYTRKSEPGELLEYLILLINFFLKRFSIKFESENPIDSFHPLVVAPKNRGKVKKMIKKFKKQH